VVLIVILADPSKLALPVTAPDIAIFLVVVSFAVLPANVESDGVLWMLSADVPAAF